MPYKDGKWTPLQIPGKHTRVLLDNSKAWRFRVLYGGRNSAKDYSFVDVALERGVRMPTRFICVREQQNTIADSIHQLLSDRVNELGLSPFYHITNNEIVGSNGTSFSFRGLKDMNAEQIKSFQGADIAIVVEGQSLSKKSFDMLDPTIRKPGSEIWIEFNTQYEDDFVFQRFVVNPPENAIVEKVNYYDNPWTSQVILDQVERDRKEKDPDFANKWLGEPCRVGGRIYPQFDNRLDPVGNVRVFPWELVRTQGNCLMSIDPHAHYYPFCTWLAIVPKNKRHRWPDDYYKWVYAEWPTFDTLGGYYSNFRKEKQYHGDLSELAKEIFRQDGKSQYGLTMFERGIDPRFAAGSGSWSWSSSTEGIVNLFRKPENGGLDFTLPQCKVLDCQRDVIRSDLRWQTMSERSEWNEPSLYVAPWCKNMIQMLSSHRTQEGTEKEDEKFKEGSDTLKIIYALLDGWKYRDPITRRTPQQESDALVHSNISAGNGMYGSDGWMA